MCISFEPTFHWNKDRTKITGIGIRATNALCNASVEESKKDKKNRKLRSEIISKYGLTFDKDIKSSVPRLTYALTNGVWVKDNVDFYKKIYEKYEPSGQFTNEKREAIKSLFMRMYFDNTDNNLSHHIWLSVGLSNSLKKDDIKDIMDPLRKAMRDVLGPVAYNNYIFYFESCIYLETLEILLDKGYFVWQVYDCFYGKGFGDQEEFERYVLDAVNVCFIRFKMANDFDDWNRY